MKNLIDTIFNPLLTWLTSCYTSIDNLIVPLSRPLDLNKYLGIFSYLGTAWVYFITISCTLAFVYVVSYIVVSQQGMLIRFKDLIKWW
jgi:hypothetical protein